MPLIVGDDESDAVRRAIAFAFLLLPYFSATAPPGASAETTVSAALMNGSG